MEELRPGQILDGRYELLQPLGRGGFGAVWLALDGAEQVALKVLHPRFANDARATGRLKVEAEILSTLDHPNIVRAELARRAGPYMYVAMDFIQGQTLASFLQRTAEEAGSIDLSQVSAWTGEIAAALDHAHQRGVVHRDLKPQNIMLVQEGNEVTCRVLDFGLARVLAGDAHDSTTVGRVLGTVLYMAPEQVTGNRATAASDVFALGSILFELMTLHRAWARDAEGDPLRWGGSLRDGPNHPTEISERILRSAPPSPEAYRGQCPPELTELLMQTLSQLPEARPTALDLAERLATVVAPSDTEMMLEPTPTMPNSRHGRGVIPRDGSGRPPTLTVGGSNSFREAPGGPTALIPTAAMSADPTAQLDPDPTAQVYADNTAPLYPDPTALVPPPSNTTPMIAIALTAIAVGLAAVAMSQKKAPTPIAPLPATKPLRATQVAKPRARARPQTKTSPASPQPRPSTTRRTKTRTPRRPEAETRRAPPKLARAPAAKDRLAAQLKRLEREPEDLMLVAKVSDALVKEARTLANRAKAKKVERLVRSSELVADVKGLQLAYQLLEKFKAE